MKYIIKKIFNKIKKIICYILYYFFSPFFYVKYKNGIIVFESVPNYSDNTIKIYDEFLRRKLNNKYFFVWMSWEDEEKKLNHNNCENFDFSKDDICHIIKRIVIKKRTKCIICCNRWVEPFNKKCKSIYLSHGTPIKDISNYYNMPETISYCLAASKNCINIISKQFNVENNKIIPLGFPRNDELTSTSIDLNKIFRTNNKKIVIWYPTLRKYKLSKLEKLNLNIPLINDYCIAKKINDYINKKNILLVIKPHFVEGKNSIKNWNFESIKIIDDHFLLAKNISSYEMLASSDALLTDYSSVYYDYLLHDKPIGLIWEDLNEYKKNIGLINNYEDICMGGYKIYKIEDLFVFFDDIFNDVDRLKAERKKICDWANFSNDGKNTERVANFIIKNFNL